MTLLDSLFLSWAAPPLHHLQEAYGKALHNLKSLELFGWNYYNKEVVDDFDYFLWEDVKDHHLGEIVSSLATCCPKLTQVNFCITDTDPNIPWILTEQRAGVRLYLQVFHPMNMWLLPLGMTHKIMHRL